MKQRPEGPLFHYVIITRFWPISLFRHYFGLKNNQLRVVTKNGYKKKKNVFK